MLPNRLRLPIVLLVLVLIMGGCGGDGDNPDESGGSGGDNSAGGSGSDDSSGSESSGGGENGSITFEFSGNWEGDGEYAFIPEASAFIDGHWSLSFAPNRDGSGDAIITILLIPETLYFTFGDPEFTVGGGPGQCEFDVSEESASRASGSVECTNLLGVPATGSTRDGVNFSATFDARS
jgi:hypothetical protein